MPKVGNIKKQKSKSQKNLKLQTAGNQSMTNNFYHSSVIIHTFLRFLKSISPRENPSGVLTARVLEITGKHNP